MSDDLNHLRASFTAQERQAMQSRLLRAIAHDLNNHLTVVSSFIQLVEDTVLGVDDIAADIEDATVSIDSASALASLLLTLSKPLEDDEHTSCDFDEANEQLRPLMALALGRNSKLIWRLDAQTEITLGLSQRCWLDLGLELAHAARQLQCAKMTIWLASDSTDERVARVYIKLEGASLVTPPDELPSLARVAEVLRARSGDLERDLDADAGGGHHLVVKLPLA